MLRNSSGPFSRFASIAQFELHGVFLYHAWYSWHFRSYSLSVNRQASTLIVTTCRLSKVYTDVYLLEKGLERCGHIQETLAIEEDEEEDESPAPKTRAVASFYEVDDGLLVCQVVWGSAAVEPSGLNDLANKV